MDSGQPMRPSSLSNTPSQTSAITPDRVIRSYLPALIFVGLGTALGLVFAVINSFIGAKPRKRAAKFDPYESGMPSDVPQGIRFGISFYLIAMLFILFDIEVIFLYPVAIQLKAFGTFALVETIVFVVLLFVAFIYVWRRGALEWR
jgi:NADH-quinone oxidoreductase subunit A